MTIKSISEVRGSGEIRAVGTKSERISELLRGPTSECPM